MHTAGCARPKPVSQLHSAVSDTTLLDAFFVLSKRRTRDETPPKLLAAYPVDAASQLQGLRLVLFFTRCDPVFRNISASAITRETTRSQNSSTQP